MAFRKPVKLPATEKEVSIVADPAAVAIAIINPTLDNQTAASLPTSRTPPSPVENTTIVVGSTKEETPATLSSVSVEPTRDPPPTLPSLADESSSPASSGPGTGRTSLTPSFISSLISTDSVPGIVAPQVNQTFKLAPGTDLPMIPNLSTFSQFFKGYEYKIGIDNIRVGIVEYVPESIYFSAPLTLTLPTIVGLKADDRRPYLDPATSLISYASSSQEDASTYYLGSTEYWVYRQDLDIEGKVIAVSQFPILPLAKERIYHEQLVLSKRSDSQLTKNDTGYLSFYTNIVSGNVIFYRNGIETDFWINATSTEETVPNSGKPMKLGIQVGVYFPGDIFTVSYTPLISTLRTVPPILSTYTAVTGAQVTDLVGDLSARHVENNLIVLDKIGRSSNAVSTRLFLMIILRSNTADSTVSPSVEEYLFAGGEIFDSRLDSNAI